MELLADLRRRSRPTILSERAKGIYYLRQCATIEEEEGAPRVSVSFPLSTPLGGLRAALFLGGMHRLPNPQRCSNSIAWERALALRCSRTTLSAAF